MEKITYYSLYLPVQTDKGNDSVVNVFTEKDEALKLLKGNKDGRLKSFKNKEEAHNYSRTGHENLIQKFPDLKSPSATAEKAAFHAPSKQERINFRKAIEEGDYGKVKQIVWENPRYLVNIGDTPTSLKDGYRYNALHICAIHKKAEIAELILQTISTIEFVELLHGKKNSKICQEVCEILLDYYLNMPEKGRSETPLHLAVKYGAVEVVEVLTTYAKCKMLPNLENLFPKDIICDRMNDAPTALKEKIANLLEERFYVPVIRSIDGTIPPCVGQPFSPTNPPELNTDPLSPELEIQAFAGPMSKDKASNFRRRWKTPVRSSDFLASTPRKLYHISHINHSNTAARALFFSNDSEDVLKIQDTENGNSTETINTQLWNKLDTENDTKNNNGSAVNVLPKNDKTETIKTAAQNHISIFNNANVFALTPLLKKDPSKRDMFFTYREVKYIDSPIQFNETSNSNNSEYLTDSPLALREMNVKLSDTEKGLEMVGRELAKEQKIEWKEYWDFLGIFVDIASPAGLELLEQHLKLKKNKLESEMVPDIKPNDTKKINREELLHLCDELHKFGLIKDKNNITSPGQKNNSNPTNFSNINESPVQASKFPNTLTINGINENKTMNNNQQSTTTPYLCVEKSLQVFAKRCTKTILNNIKNVVSIYDSFLSELKRLKSLICSFKDDPRFLDVDFTYVHSRFANLIVSYLKTFHDTDDDTLVEIQDCFQQIIQSRIKTIDKCLNSPTQTAGDKKEQLQCVAEFILIFLTDPNTKILPENLKTEKICSKTWSNEFHCECQWETVLSRQASRKKRYDSQNEISKKLFPVKNANGNRAELNSVCNNSWRSVDNDSDETSEVNLSDSDDDIFYSDFGSEDEHDYKFYTPPQSPKHFDLDESNDTDEYNVYVLGAEPTKRDLDVLNALFHLEIDQERHPNIYLWRSALLKYPNDERDNFPSPAVIGKKQVTHRNNNNFINKKLFSPNKLTSSPITKNHLTKFANENLMRQNNNLNNSDIMINDFSIISDISESSSTNILNMGDITSDLSYMNISEN